MGLLLDLADTRNGRPLPPTLAWVPLPSTSLSDYVRQTGDMLDKPHASRIRITMFVGVNGYGQTACC